MGELMLYSPVILLVFYVLYRSVVWLIGWVKSFWLYQRQLRAHRIAVEVVKLLRVE